MAAKGWLITMGSTVFVPFVLPAERVAVEAVEQKKKFVRGRVERVLQAAPERVEARAARISEFAADAITSTFRMRRN